MIRVGFAKTFKTNQSDLKHHNNKSFTVIRELTENEAHIQDVGKMYKILLSSGEEIYAFEDEVSDYQQQIHLKELVEHLQKELEEHGDIPVYSSNDGLIEEEIHLPHASKVYTTTYGMLGRGRLERADSDLFKPDLTKPVTKGIIF